VDAQIVDADGEPLGPHAAGELIVRTPGMMLGYLDDPEATHGVLRDGWLWSGDLGRRDENGFYSLLGRRDSRINSSGFKVQPEEIEAVLALHPGVLEVAVTADPDPVRGEAIRAVIVPASRPPSPAELMRFCRARLAAYKVPRRFEFVDHLPRTPLGKLRRSHLARNSPDD
jgi:acyl-CoA synthetase (AMP-forming)/AMP-acid ligase II